MKEDLEEDKWWEEKEECDWSIKEDMFPAINRIVQSNLTEEEAITMCRSFSRECDAYTSYSVVRTKK